MSFLDKQSLETEVFDKMPGYIQRMIIMLDIILFLNTNKIIASTNGYISLEKGSLLDLEGSIKTYLEDAEASKCSVCQKGAMMLSLVARKNNLNWEDLNSYGRTLNPASKGFLQLEQYFTAEQLHMMEHAYESFNPYHHSREGGVTKWVNGMRSTGYYPNTAEIMLQICYNVIQNKGEFQPRTFEVECRQEDAIKTVKSEVENYNGQQIKKENSDGIH